MRVKRYEAESMQEAIMKVRAELGRDAVILHSKKFRRGGAFGLFGKQMFEVIAAIDVGNEASKQAKPSVEEAKVAVGGAEVPATLTPVVSSTAPTGAQPAVLPVTQPIVQPLPQPASSVIQSNAQATVQAPEEAVRSLAGFTQSRVAAAGNPVATDASLGSAFVTVAPPEIIGAPVRGINWRPEVRLGGSAVNGEGPTVEGPVSLHGELASLRRMLHQLNTQLNRAPDEAPVANGWDETRQSLAESELAGKYLDEIEEEVFRALSDQELASAESVREVVAGYLSDRFLVERRNLARIGRGPRVVALVGPTGVGKTTTVAKLAAQYALFSGKSVGLITVDTYRIAAVEQLKTYAEIINVPVEVAFSPSEVALALARLQDKDVVVVDTAGRSQKNEIQMAELKQFLATAAPTETHLVLSVTTKYRDLLDCLERFKEISYDHLIFTKLDETSCYGSIFNCVMEAKCPVMYLTCGQNVPDDLVEASRERLTELLLGTGVLRQ